MSKELQLESHLHLAVSSADNELNIGAIDAFCGILKKDPDLNSLGCRLLAQKIQSNSIHEAILALDALEECMDTCGADFQLEVNKFKFLNELIRLVSKKFLGDRTPKEIKDRILDILFTWSDRYPHLSKVKEAYQMLKTQGVIHEPMKNVIKRERQQDNSSKDSTLKLMESEKFKKLLYSKNTNDIQAANLMIQNMVRDNDRRMQMQNRRLMNLQSAYENILLLNEMLDQYKAGETSEDLLITLRDLYGNCEQLKPTIVRLAEESEGSESEGLLTKILETSDSLEAVIEKYKSIMLNQPQLGIRASKTPVKVNTNLLDVSSTTQSAGTSSNHNYQDLSDIFSSSTTKDNFQIDSILTPEMNKAPQDFLLKDDIFSAIPAPTNGSSASTPLDDLMKNFDIQQKNHSILPKPKVEVKPSKFLELDSIVSGMKTSLLAPETPDKVEENVAASFEDDIKILDVMEESILEKVKTVEVAVKEVKKSLQEINIDLNDVEPSSEPPRTILDEPKGLKVELNFSKDRPREDVLVVVLTVINQGKQPISKFQFDASISKPGKTRLLPASSQELPGVKPFKPPTENIMQILLVSNPTEIPVNIVCIVSYCLDDDPDPIKESFEVKNIPFKCE